MPRLNYPHLMSMLFNQPLMVTPDKAQIVIATLRDRMNISGLSELLPDGESGFKDLTALAKIQNDAMSAETSKQASIGGSGGYRATDVADVVNGVMLIDVHGTLIHRGGLDPYSGMTAYSGIAIKIDLAMSDPDVNAVMLNIDSPGGSVSGCFDLVDKIANLAKVKPVWSTVEDQACSAAYAIASASSKILVTQTADTGSIGVITVHMDHSKYLDNEGIKPTIIRAGDFKAEGNPYEELSKGAFERIQTSVNDCYDVFVGKVSEFRGIEEKAVRSTEAAVFGPKQSIELGLADEISTAEHAFQTLAASVAGETTGASVKAQAPKSVTSIKSEKQMATKSAKSKTQQASEDDEKDKDLIDDEEEETAVDEKPEEDAEDDDSDEEMEDEEDDKSAQSFQSGRSAERKRISAIMESKEGKANAALANHLAYKTGMTVTNAKAALAAAGPSGAAASGTTALGLKQAMQGEVDPSLGTGAESNVSMSEEDMAVQRILDA